MMRPGVRRCGSRRRAKRSGRKRARVTIDLPVSIYTRLRYLAESRSPAPCRASRTVVLPLLRFLWPADHRVVSIHPGHAKDEAKGETGEQEKHKTSQWFDQATSCN